MNIDDLPNEALSIVADWLDTRDRNAASLLRIHRDERDEEIRLASHPSVTIEIRAHVPGGGSREYMHFTGEASLHTYVMIKRALFYAREGHLYEGPQAEPSVSLTPKDPRE